MTNDLTRRGFVTSASVACLPINGIAMPAAMAAVPGNIDVAGGGKRVTLLHFTD